MKRCIQCQGTDLQDVAEMVPVRVPMAGGELEVRVSGVSAARCSTCGESYLKGPDLERADLLASAEAMRRGLRDGPTLEFIRRALGLRAAKLAELLGVPTAVVSQWEDGHRAVERSVWNALADLVSDELAGATTTLDRLRALTEPRVPTDPVRVDLGLAGAS